MLKGLIKSIENSLVPWILDPRTPRSVVTMTHRERLLKVARDGYAGDGGEVIALVKSLLAD